LIFDDDAVVVAGADEMDRDEMDFEGGEDAYCWMVRMVFDAVRVTARDDLH